MKALWEKITRLGLDGTVASSYVKFIVITNSTSAIVILWILGFTPSLLFFLPTSLPIILMNWGFAAMWCFTLFLNYKKKYLLAKIYFGAVAGFSIAMFAIAAGIETYIHLYSLVVMIAAFLIFSDKERLYTYLTAGVCIAMFFLLDYLKPEPLIKADTFFIEFARLNLIAMLFIITMLLMIYSNRVLRGAETKLSEEKRKSEELLLNILPQDVAHELKEFGSAEPVRYDNVTVLFTDFIGFTKISENMKAEQVIDELDKCFSQFDEVTRRNNLEKIKTIGDSYMLAGGLPAVNNTHSIDCVLAALEIQAFMNQMKQIKSEQGLPFWQLRLGINTGPLVAGVVGQMKFAYDVFGDTVNTASRIESAGVAGRINISKSVYDNVRFLFACEHRGKIQAKHKGVIDMFFVNGIKPRFSVNGEGRVPNDEFKDVYEKVKQGARLVARPKD